MGSLVYVGGLALDDAYAIRGIDGATVGDELRRIGYVGAAKPGWLTPHAYLELHIEQGPILENEGLVIGAVEGITGLGWTEVSITGRSAHAGTTPMHMRRDAAYAASEIALFARRLAPTSLDYFVLKPANSAFYCTTLRPLLEQGRSPALSSIARCVFPPWA